jgi:ribosomal protein L9
MKLNKKSCKIVLKEHLTKNKKCGSVIEVTGGYARYLINNGIAVYYSAENEKKYAPQTAAPKKDYTELLLQHINGIKLPFVRESNRSGVLYRKITPKNVMDAIYEAIKPVVGEELAQQLKRLNPTNVISITGNIKSSNAIYTIETQGRLQGATLHLVVAGSTEQCDELIKGGK